MIARRWYAVLVAAALALGCTQRYVVAPTELRKLHEHGPPAKKPVRVRTTSGEVVSVEPYYRHVLILKKDGDRHVLRPSQRDAQRHASRSPTPRPCATAPGGCRDRSTPLRPR